MNALSTGICFLASLTTILNNRRGKKGMVKLREFNLMSKGQQIGFLWDECQYITVRVENNFRINLYGCMDFYAEVWYKIGVNRIYKIGSFKSIQHLKPYIKNVDISDFLRCLK